MGRPKVLHVTTTDMSLELLLGPQLSAFVDAGYDVHGASAPGRYVPMLEARGVRHLPLHSSTRSMSLLSDLAAARELAGVIRRLRPDVVHTHNPKPGVYGRVLGRVLRVPAVVNTVHGLYATPEDPLLRRAVVYALERGAALFSHAELVQNPEDLALLRALRVPDSKLRLLGNGVDLGRFHPRDAEVRARVRASLGLDDSTIVVGAVGRLVAEKGYRELIEAMRSVRGAVLCVAGGAEPDKADALSPAEIRAAEAEGVRFLGNRDDVEELYAAFDVYVLASWREGFPRSAMEAAASGLPLVLTDIRGCRQVVDDGVNGLLVPPRSAAGLAAALTKLCSDPDLRAEMGRAALARATAEFDQQRVIDITLQAYERLLAR